MIQLEEVYFDDYTPNWNVTRRETTTHIIVLVTQGRLVYELNTTTETLSRGDILLIAPGTYRTGLSGSYPPHQKYSAHFLLKMSDHRVPAPAIGSKGYEIFKPRNFEYLRQRFSLLYQTWRSRSSYHYYSGNGIALELLGSALQELEEKSIPYHKLEIVKKIENYISQHYKEEIKIETLAALVHRTPNYISSIFKEVTGQTIIEYIHRFRISTARDLLLHSDLNIAEISNFLGFCDPSYFNRIFKKNMGQAPSILLKLRNNSEINE